MKIFKKIAIYYLISALLISSAVSSAPRASAAPELTLNCGAAVLADMDTGTVLYSVNPDAKMYPASLTKIMTAIVALEACQNGKVSFSDNVTCSPNLYSDIDEDASTLNLAVGEILSFEDLMYCVVLRSASEPCNAVAEHVSGSISAFIGEMNDKAASLGCTGTHFSNTHGLPDSNNYSTARDLMLIMRKAMSMPMFAKLTATEEYTLPATNMSEERPPLKNTNNLIREKSTYYYEYAKGGKTGYTEAAGFCLASAAQKGDVRLVSVVLKTNSVVLSDGTTQVQSFSETKRLFQWGFANFSYRTVLSTMRIVREVDVELGNGANKVALRPAEPIILLIDNSADLSKVEYTVRLNIPDGEKLTAPITAGEELGEADVIVNGVSYGTVKLVANYSVELDKAKFISSQIQNTLKTGVVRFIIIALILMFVLYIAFIIYYNVRRQKKKKAANELARQKIEAIRAKEALTTGLTFEEIEKKQELTGRYRRR